MARTPVAGNAWKYNKKAVIPNKRREKAEKLNERESKEPRDD